jgi:hypothetical protein
MSVWRCSSLLAAAGCTASAPAAPAAGAPVTVSLWLNTTGGSTRADCVQQHVVDPYNAAAGAVRVESTMQANLWDATRTALAGGAGPDIIVTPGPSFAVELGQGRPTAAPGRLRQPTGVGPDLCPVGAEAGSGGRQTLQPAQRSGNPGALLQQDPLRPARLDAAQDPGRADGPGGGDRRGRRHPLRPHQRRVAAGQRVACGAKCSTTPPAPARSTWR